MEFLQVLLAAWPVKEAVRVCDAQGKVVAQNGRALEAVAKGHAPLDDYSGDFWKVPQVRQSHLLNGWQIEARPALQVYADEGSAAAESQGAGGSHFPDAPPQEPGATGGKPVELQTLARGIVHELRNPLAAIVTAAGLLQEDPASSDETQMLLDVIRKESHRMNRILAEFAAYVKPRPPQPASFDLVEAVHQEVADLLREKGRRKHPAIATPEVKVEDALPAALHVHADEEHLRDVLRHVLRNAFEAMPRGGALRVEAHEDHRVGTTRLWLWDSGSGLGGEALERAFQPFFSSKSQSTGLGLSIARSAVEASGGRIWIENSSFDGHQSGARVAIELPSARAAKREEPKEEPGQDAR